MFRTKRRHLVVPYSAPVLGPHRIGVGITSERFDELDAAVRATHGMAIEDLKVHDKVEALGLFKTEATEQVVALAEASDQALRLVFEDGMFEYDRHNPAASQELRSMIARHVAPLPLTQTVAVEYLVVPAFNTPLRLPAEIRRSTFFVRPEGIGTPEAAVVI